MFSDIVHYLAKITNVVARVVFFILFLRFFIIEPSVVNGQSMEPGLRDGDPLVVNKVTPLFMPLTRYERVQVLLPKSNDKLLVKRVIGLPGETVMFKRNTIYIRPVQGQEFALSEPYLRPDVIVDVPYGAPREYTVPAHSYYVLGDNRMYSLDSRSLGPVHRSRIIGRVWSF